MRKPIQLLDISLHSELCMSLRISSLCLCTHRDTDPWTLLLHWNKAKNKRRLVFLNYYQTFITYYSYKVNEKFEKEITVS